MSPFVKYLSTEQLLVEMWDGNSQLPFANFWIDLRELLRGGEPVIQTLLSIPVFRFPLGRGVVGGGTWGPGLSSGSSSVASRGLASPAAHDRLGTVFVKIANVGLLGATSVEMRQEVNHTTVHEVSATLSDNGDVLFSRASLLIDEVCNSSVIKAFSSSSSFTCAPHCKIGTELNSNTRAMVC